MKKVRIPPRMQTAGRVDFVLQKAAADAEATEANPTPSTAADYDRFDPYNQYERYTMIADMSQIREERAEKPWWWNYFILPGRPAPTWLLKHF